MATRKQYTPIPHSPIEYENTGVFTSLGRTFKTIGWDFDTNQAIVKNDRSEYRLLTNTQIKQLATNP